MTKQEYLKQVTIGNVSELSGLIELKEYDPAWAALYEAERQKINNALKRNEIMLDFRDWLRTHEADRNLYADTKRCLVQKRWKYLQDYADAKSGVVREIFKHIVLNYRICQLTELYIPEMQALFHDTIITRVRDKKR